MMKFLDLFWRVIKHDLVSGSFYVFVGFFISSILAFIFNLFLARSLSYAEYGTYSSLLSILTLATIPAGSLSVVVVRFATSYFANDDIDHASSFYKKSLMFWGFIGIFIFILYAILSPFLASFLKITEIGIVLIIGGAISASYFGVSNSTFLQALTKFKYISFVSGVTMLTRLVFGVVVIFSGYGLFGATGAILVSIIVGFVFGIIPLKFLLFHKAKNVDLHIKEIIKYGLPASFSILFLSSFISSDILLVKHFFTSHEAGFYGGMSLVGKVIFYFTGTVPMVMFPLLIKREAKGESVRNLLYLSFILVLIPSISITLFYFLFPEFTIRLFLGGRDYLSFADYLGFFGIFIAVFSLNNILLNFFLSLKKTFVVYLVGAGALLQLVLIGLFHSNFDQIISANIISSLFLLLILLIYYVKEYGLHNVKEQRSKNVDQGSNFTSPQ